MDLHISRDRTRRRMFSVALVGPDGVGKTTIARHLEARAAFPVRYLYMGDNPAASNVTLPTTRWWKARMRKAGAETVANTMRRRGPVRRARRAVRKTLGFANRIGEELYRQAVASRWARGGAVVVFDRHFLWDRWHTEVSGNGDRSFKRRLHGLFLRHVAAAPDLVVCLDAPGEVVFRRKGELTPEILERRRTEYLGLRDVAAHFELVDANRELPLVARDVEAIIGRYREAWSHGR